MPENSEISKEKDIENYTNDNNRPPSRETPTKTNTQIDTNKL